MTIVRTLMYEKCSSRNIVENFGGSAPDRSRDCALPSRFA